ncbi:MAG: hypothetical protein ICV59_06635 [Thermoleophilia bacterium]|nr:hypothetical protein [Thermoleophilia bacterium]
MLLLVVAVLVAARPSDAFPRRAAAIVFASLIAVWALTRLSGPVDPLGVITKAVELIGLLVALSLERGETRVGARVPAVYVAFGLLLAVQAGHGH